MGLEKDIEKELNWKSFVAVITFAAVVYGAAILDYYVRDKGEYLNLNKVEKVIEFYDNRGERQEFGIIRDEKNWPKIIYSAEK